MNGINFQNPLSPPKLPPESELWKDNEKELYRPWIIFFLFIVISLFIVYAVFLYIAFSFKESSIQEFKQVVSGLPGNSNNFQAIVAGFTSTYNTIFLITPTIFTVILGLSLIYFGYTLNISYKSKSLRFLSQIHSLIIGLISAIGIFSIFSFVSTITIYPLPVIFYIVLIISTTVIWFFPTQKIKKFKYAFLRSYQSQKYYELLNNSQFKNQTNNAFGQNQNQGFPFGNPFVNPNFNNPNPQNPVPSNDNSTPNTNPVNSDNNVETASDSSKKALLDDLSTEQLHLIAERLLISGHQDMKRKELMSRIINVMESEEENGKKTELKDSKSEAKDEDQEKNNKNDSNIN